ncbi:MAG: class I SAM-dependent RNA methyltransferase [Desulfobacterium sp.]|jgi:putative N6-adenine-specific DNA methylase|nr:class I SAM-dependent RNA methyltransferase [Desulfobacterium sp.]
MEPIKTIKSNVIRKRPGQHKRYATGFKYQQDPTFFAQIANDLIKEGEVELKELGALDVTPSFRGIFFKAEKDVFYRINYQTRLFSRILAPLTSFTCKDTDILYREAKKIKWENLFKKKSTFAITSNVSDSEEITHSQYAGLRLKDAIADYFRERTGKRPDVNTLNPDVMINLHIRKETADISIDASGGALHRRGYREESITAPMQETIAAAIINLSKWDGTRPLYDPMCGSGTLLCEALMHQCRIPAGIFRQRFGFEILPDFNPELWDQVKKGADAKIIPIEKGLIAGSDIAPESVNAARTNLMGIHHGGQVPIFTQDFRDIEILEDTTIVANPPYGIRMGKESDLKAFHREFGDFLKQKCKGSSAYIYFGDPIYASHMGLKATWKRPLKAGGLDGRLVRYDMY